MKELLEKKAFKKLSEHEIEQFNLFCTEKKKWFLDSFPVFEEEIYLNDDMVLIEKMKHSSELSNILGQLLVKKDQVLIILNDELLEKISLENKLDYEAIKRKVLLHEYLHYYAYLNNIELVFKRQKIFSLKIKESEELIINDLVDYYFDDGLSIYQLYEYI